MFLLWLSLEPLFWLNLRILFRPPNTHLFSAQLNSSIISPGACLTFFGRVSRTVRDVVLEIGVRPSHGLAKMLYKIKSGL